MNSLKRFLPTLPVALLCAGCIPHPTTPVESWTRVAPESTDFSYEKMRRLLDEMDGKAQSLVIARFGYLIWDDGPVDEATTLPANLSDSIRRLLPPLDPDIPESLQSTPTPTPLHIARQALLLKRGGEWDGRSVLDRAEVHAALQKSDTWSTAAMPYDAGSCFYAGSRDSLWILLCPEQSILLVAVAPPDSPLPPATEYAKALIDSIRAME